MKKQLKENVCEIAKKSYINKLVAGTSGNVSYYDREKNRMFITPSNVDYELMKPEDIVILDLDGNIIESESNFKPSSEWRMHAEIYKNKEDINSIIHTHSPKATSFAVVHKDIPIILVEMIPFIGGDIKRAKFSLPGTAELGITAAKALEDRNVCLLENHGVVAVGNSLEQAYIRAVYAEDAAIIYFNALQVGEPVLLSEETNKILYEKYKK
ncbi:class II aldolase/adducin family protein [Helcococcus kunzii]|uniref:L-ribulose-5-phosphate 4-epimerase n=1 Tax=Helcococcus kunzii ATCC 51366 TaxID=883114 RepID=H3NMC2_9FIRM|nr:class II aldolase/adducin family protein [Helcococcus kunzii]EHR35057.1 L-ribulose-5-phosphate 4-epimerase [Helcococcus kunzii ATCC 51366]MCT1796074.1 class II aldolase/adducin family protein [Helcococcus kunzii]MCT1989769.1 class II aldolase/adducin family protein [Helcococcus kunzii]QUY64438.1 class II aldolase/adducin family protein [Helcococcus kunzii]QZO76849.1 class II aldolase/adducin family protein [Helcococcus kunzii]